MKSNHLPDIIFRDLGLVEYASTFSDMRHFTHSRNQQSPDEIWCLEHLPVYTLGQQGERQQILNRNDIPVVQTDRGGHVTYHGPGQLVVYPLLNLRRYQLGVREFVTLIENLIIELLEKYDLVAHARSDAPGVYIQKKKIASLGLRVSKGCSYHGLALNINMDLKPFFDINPCGMQDLQMAQMADYIPDITVAGVNQQLQHLFLKKLQNISK